MTGRDLPWEWQGTLVPDDLKTLVEEYESDEEMARALAMAERHLKKQERNDLRLLNALSWT